MLSIGSHLFHVSQQSCNGATRLSMIRGQLAGRLYRSPTWRHWCRHCTATVGSMTTTMTMRWAMTRLPGDSPSGAGTSPRSGRTCRISDTCTEISFGFLLSRQTITLKGCPPLQTKRVKSVKYLRNAEIRWNRCVLSSCEPISRQRWAESGDTPDTNQRRPPLRLSVSKERHKGLEYYIRFITSGKLNRPNLWLVDS